MTRNAAPAHTGYPIGNQGRWHNEIPEPEHEVEDIDEDDALPLPERFSGWAIPRPRQETRR